jgi:hypothetical protein
MRLKVKGSSPEGGIRFLPHPLNSKTNKLGKRMARTFADCLPFHKRFPYAADVLARSQFHAIEAATT